MEEVKNIHILYHGNCTDGFSSATVINKKFKDDPSVKIHSHPVTHDESEVLPSGLEGEIYMVDFAYPRDEMIKLSKTASKITIYDHHKSAEIDLLGISSELHCDSDIIFDVTRAGCQITWDNTFENQKRPQSIERIADRDLNFFKHHETKPVTACFYQTEHDFNIWEKMIDDSQYEAVLELGIEIEEESNRLIEALSNDTKIVTINGYSVSMVPAPIELAADIGMRMLDDHDAVDFSLSYRKKGDLYHFSLRSMKEEVDVSLIAKEFGGGGHAVSAGFRSETLPWESNEGIPSVIDVKKESSFDFENINNTPK